MSNHGLQHTIFHSNSPIKRVIDDPEDGERFAKRQKVASVEDLGIDKEFAPRSFSSEQHTTAFNPTGTILSAPNNNQRRMAVLNLKNYPSNPHPVGIAVWIVQKVEQARRDSETHSSGGANRGHSDIWNILPGSGRPTTDYGHPVPAAINSSFQWQSFQYPSYAQYPQYPSAYEQEAERLQAQRNRKTKQRYENWAKNKENDVVARSKLEAKKKFGPNISDADQQAWIEEKIKVDFGRLLDRLALQLNSEIVTLPPYQFGFAEYYFNAENNPRDLDDQTLYAGRLMAAVLPALAESQISPQSQRAADSLIRALQNNNPRVESFYIAIHVLAEHRDMVIGIDRVLGNLFTPKTGPQLARKRASIAADKSGSPNFSNGSYSVFAGSAPIWHWKEPATIANSTPLNTQPQNSTASSNNELANMPNVTWAQYLQQSSELVQAGVFQPPPPSPVYNHYGHEKNSQTAPYNTSVKALSLDNGIESARTSEANDTLPRGSSQAIPKSNGDKIIHPKYPSPPPSSVNIRRGGQTHHATVNGDSIDRTHPPRPSTTLKDAEPEVELSSLKPDSLKDPANGLANHQRSSANSIKFPTRNPKFSSQIGMRRRSSRDRVLTTKALAAGILLGQSQNTAPQAPGSDNPVSPSKISKGSPESGPRSSSRGRKLSLKALGAQEHGQLTVSNNTENTASPVSPEPPRSPEEVVPRSSGRERKPTAKVLAAKENSNPKACSVSPTQNQSLPKTTKTPSSIPKVSSKLRLSILLHETSSPPISGTQPGPSRNQELPLERGQEVVGAALSEGDANLALLITMSTPEPAVVQSSLANAGLAEVSAMSSTGRFTSEPRRQEALIQDQRHQNPRPVNPAIRFISDALDFQEPKRSLSRTSSSQVQTLLLMANIAADWPDSDDENQPGTEHVFQANLARALLSSAKKPSRASQEPKYTLPEYLQRFSPQRPHENRPMADSYGQRLQEATLASNFPVLRTSHPQFQSKILPTPTTTSSIARHWQTSVNEITSTRNSVTVGSASPFTDGRSGSQIADEWVALVRIKDEARTRGIVVNHNMDFKEIDSLIKAHDSAEIDLLGISSFRALAPTPARPTTIPHSTSVSENRGIYKHAQVRDPSPKQWSPSAYHLTRQMARPRPSCSNVESILQVDGTTEFRSSRPGTGTDSIDDGSSAASLAGRSRSTAQLSSRYEFNPRGLNGGPPGGGTIINGPETRESQARLRQKSKAPDFAMDVNGKTDQMRRSVEAERRSNGSLTPQPQLPRKFKRGGQLISFGQS